MLINERNHVPQLELTSQSPTTALTISADSLYRFSYAVMDSSKSTMFVRRLFSTTSSVRSDSRKPNFIQRYPLPFLPPEILVIILQHSCCNPWESVLTHRAALSLHARVSTMDILWEIARPRQYWLSRVALT